MKNAHPVYTVGALLFGISYATSTVVRRQAQTIPDYVTRFAPLVYIDVNDIFLPSDISAQLLNSRPEVNSTQLSNTPSNLTLDNLSSLNAEGNCDSFSNCWLYLSSDYQHILGGVEHNPLWVYGVIPDPSGKTENATSAAVVVNDHGNGLVDAYYFYFYAYNLGNRVDLTSLHLSNGVTSDTLGTHLGDWEHTMLRFQDGTPQTIWYSAHDSGFTYTYDAVSKNDSRPIVYSSLGGHANYPTPGTQSRTEVIEIDDFTSAGPLWDPIASAYFYTFTPSNSSIDTNDSKNGTFAAVDPTSDAPTDWLYYLGKWGDKQLPDSDGRQLDVAGLAFALVDGPTGPLDKDLNRSGTCPDSESPCNTTSVLPKPSGETKPAQSVTRPQTATTQTSTASTSSSGSATMGAGGSSPTASSAGTSVAEDLGESRVLIILMAILGLTGM
ncbi:MAG: hypothetical protein M1820_006618 [Bogoriella megaspora]|nr:MAG: hypothetical protein M1820_006618 [Bogoriella megaspora]